MKRPLAYGHVGLLLAADCQDCHIVLITEEQLHWHFNLFSRKLKRTYDHWREGTLAALWACRTGHYDEYMLPLLALKPSVRPRAKQRDAMRCECIKMQTNKTAIYSYTGTVCAEDECSGEQKLCFVLQLHPCRSFCSRRLWCVQHASRFVYFDFSKKIYSMKRYFLKFLSYWCALAGGGIKIWGKARAPPPWPTQLPPMLMSSKLHPHSFFRLLIIYECMNLIEVAGPKIFWLNLTI